jgi:hypothetical protein
VIIAKQVIGSRLRSVPVLAELHRKLLIWKGQLLPKHPMAHAVDHTLGQWEALTVFTTDGAVPIDNNVSEREMKRVVLNRKSSLFVGNSRGGRTAAIRPASKLCSLHPGLSLLLPELTARKLRANVQVEKPLAPPIHPSRGVSLPLPGSGS